MDLPQQLFFTDVTAMVSAVRREHEDCFSCVFSGRVCLLMWRQGGGGGGGNCLIHMQGDKKWWD